MGSYQKYLFRLILVLVVILSVWFVMAETTPTSLYFEGNSTQNYDNDGVFSLNWSYTENPPKNFIVWVSSDGGSTWTKTSNDSVTGYQITGGVDTQKYTFKVQGINATDYESANVSSEWMIVDTTNPIISYTSNADSADGGANRTWIFVNVSASDTNNHSLIFSLYNETFLVDQTIVTDDYATTYKNWTGLPEAKYTFNVTANDSATNENSTSSRIFYLDKTNPETPSLTRTKFTTTKITVSFSCNDALGLKSCTLSSSSGTVSGSTISGLNCGNSYRVTVTAEDYAGNTATNSESFRTSGCGKGEFIPQPPRKIRSWTLITPGVTAIMKDFSSEFGIRQIQIDVNNPAQNVKIIVTKHDGKPAEVAVEKSGKVYQYLQIGAENLENTLDKATVEFRVERTWAAGVGLGKNDIAVFRYNETASRWDELTTTSTGEDATYYYYEIELDRFSYFAIGEKVVIGPGEGEEDELAEEIKSKWIIIIVVVLIILVILYFSKKKKIA